MQSGICGKVLDIARIEFQPSRHGPHSRDQRRLPGRIAFHRIDKLPLAEQRGLLAQERIEPQRGKIVLPARQCLAHPIALGDRDAPAELAGDAEGAFGQHAMALGELTRSEQSGALRVGRRIADRTCADCCSIDSFAAGQRIAAERAQGLGGEQRRDLRSQCRIAGAQPVGAAACSECGIE